LNWTEDGLKWLGLAWHMSGYATYQAMGIKGAARFLEYSNSSNPQSHFQ
jgi:hypothetical protein